MHLCTLHVWLKRPSVPLCWVRQHWRRHQGVGLQGVVGKQERGVHYKRRLNPEERPNINGKRRRGCWDQGESRGDTRGVVVVVVVEGCRQTVARRLRDDEDWIRGDFIPTRTTRLPLNKPESALVIRRQQRAARGKGKRLWRAARLAVSGRSAGGEGVRVSFQHLRTRTAPTSHHLRQLWPRRLMPTPDKSGTSLQTLWRRDPRLTARSICTRGIYR